MEHVVTPWEGGGRAMGAEWKSDLYTREGLKNVDLLTVSKLQGEKTSALSATPGARGTSSRSSVQTLFSRLGFSGNREASKSSSLAAAFVSSAGKN